MSLKIRHVGIEEAEGIDLRQELRAEGVMGGAEGFSGRDALLRVHSAIGTHGRTIHRPAAWIAPSSAQ